MSQVLLLSIKPEFVEKIFNGEKNIELRKSAPNVAPGDLIVIYSTMPVKAVIGICQVKEILKMTPSRMWKLHSKSLGIDKKRFLEYYENMSLSVGIVLTAIQKFPDCISLESLKKKHPPFQPPQTFRYYHQSLFLANTASDLYSRLQNAS
jgi:predicted transcriptional regulator